MSASPSEALPSFISRLQRFETVASTQAVVRGWLDAGTEQVCLAVADEQTAGRGRMGRVWLAPRGRALNASLGFRPAGLGIAHGWRLPAVVSMAMVEAATGLLGPTADRIALKWPNDIVAVHHGRLLKLAGVLAEGVPAGDRVDISVVGLGINVDWPRSAFPADLAESMWSLSEAAGGRRVDRDALLGAWLARLEPLYAALCDGTFDADRWMALQVTTGARVEVDQGQGIVRGIAVGVDGETGALMLQREPGDALARIDYGDVVHCRLADLSSDL